MIKIDAKPERLDESILVYWGLVKFFMKRV